MAKKRVLPAGEFKTHCLAVMDRVHDTGEEVTITKQGKPVAKVVPVTDEAEPLFGRLKGWVTSAGDLVSPIDVEWEAACRGARKPISNASGSGSPPPSATTRRTMDSGETDNGSESETRKG